MAETWHPMNFFLDTGAEPAPVIDLDLYQQVLGEELRQERGRRGWTRLELQARLQDKVSLQTLGSYELGQRALSVSRLAVLCAAMEILPQDVIARVHQRVVVTSAGPVEVDLRELAATTHPELLPARRWAEKRLAEPSDSETIELTLDVLELLAELCGQPVLTLCSFLRAPRS